MHTTQYIKRCFLILILFISYQGFSQLSKTHYIPPLTNSPSGNANPEDQYIYLSTPSGADIPYTIMPVGQATTSYITGTVSNTNPQQIAIGTGNGQLFVPSDLTNRVINDRGYIIEAEGTIYVSIRMNAGNAAQAGALVSKGLSALGNTFRIGSYTNQNPQDNYLNFLSVMATEDNTIVSFPNISNTLVIEGPTIAETVPANVTLNKGESYTIATRSDKATANQDGLIGSLITSDKPIVVNCGSTNGSFGTGNGRDYGIDQIVDLSKVGTEYIFVRGNGNDAWENVLVVAHTDNTAIYVNGNATPISTINAGSYYAIEGNQFNTNGNMYVETSQPVFAYQGVGGLGNNGTPNEANQGMFFVPPLSCEARGNLDNIANINNIGSTIYSGGVSVVTKVGATVLINGSPITSFSTVGPSSVDGKPDYITYKVTGLSGNISVESSDELYCAYFNYNGSATSGSFYSGFPSAPEINFDAQFATLGNCIPNIRLEAANTQNFDSFQWLFDDGTGSGFVDMMITTPEITPMLPGKYKLIGVITCTGEMLESIEVPVSICPDDIDNDGIIDNIDIDNDNDGILNCTESRGDVIMDLSDTRPPILRFQDGSSNTTIASNNITINRTSPGTSSIRLTGAGNIISEIPQDSNGENTYDITFTEPVNVKFSEDTSYTHSSADTEFFIAKVLPLNKNITLLDPDDRLLVDSNFDGVFETGVTQVSGSEIHFKYNPTPNGSTPFEFLANQVDGFSFIHNLENINVTSNFQANLSLTCFKLDSDLDTITDSLDLDSDNDGIPDIIENTGAIITLSNLDTDLNGLDDVFDINTLPIDTDTDGVLDFYDLDSDNDGISDLIETGQLGTLLDTDLNGIEDGPSFGTNGWADVAETAPDSGIIGYILNDTDNDTIFDYIDYDSDGDLCSDVLEAGFSDANGDNYLGDIAVTVDAKGLVISASDGYTLPNSDYLNNAPITIDNQPTNTEVCEFSNTTLSIVSSTFDTIQWEVSTDGINWNPIIDDTIYSNAQSTDLNITAVPLTYNNYQYRARLERNGNSCGLYSDEIILTINAQPIANPVLDLELCDNLDDGDDFNGIAQSFNLESQTATILGTQSATDFTVTYHLSSADAIAGSSALTSPHANTASPNSETIFVRVLNNVTGCVNTNLNFNVIVNTLPIANPVSNIELCDDDSDGDNRNGIVQTFNLESQTNTILGTQSTTDFTVTYHLSSADAISGAGELTSPHANTLSTNSQTIYARIENHLTGCVNPYLTFDLIVNTLPFAEPVADLEACDNLDDSNDTNGIIQTWDLESQTATILGSQLATDYTVTYHLSLTDAEIGNNAITSPHTNSASPNSQTIYVRVENNTTNCVNSFSEFNLIVHPLPVINSPVTLIQCDDDIDGISFFNLTEANNEISSNATIETFTYFISASAAISGDITSTDYISTPTAYENSLSPFSDAVWARIESTFGCSRVSNIQLNVGTSQIPTGTINETLYQCDDFLDINGNNNIDNNDRDGVATFDFSYVQTMVENFFLPQTPIVTFYRNEADALSENNAITDTANYRNIGYPNTQQIYVRVDSQISNDCQAFGPYITLNVEALPVAYPVTIERQCDDDFDGEFPFDTTQIESDILGSQNPVDVTIEYFDELGNPLPSPLPNPFTTASQTISIRVTNNTTLAPDGPCYNETTLEFIVDVSPVANPVSPFIVCDGDSGDIDDDGLYTFDTSNVESTVLGSQTGMEIFYTYIDENGSLINNSTTLPNPLTSENQTITVDVINPSNTICTASTDIDFIINPLPEFSIETPQIVCSSDPNFTVILDPLEFNSSEVFTYEWTDQTGTFLSANETLTVSTPGTYFITLTKTDGTNCSRTLDVFVNASELATITQDDISVMDISDNNTITINEANLGLGDYEYALDDEFSSYQDEPFFDDVRGGIHTLYVRDKNGCGTTPIDISVIDYPHFFTPNNDGSNDNWQILGVNSQFQPQSDIFIFDRYGKLLKQINALGDGWDGTFKGKLMQSDDYWFRVMLEDGREFSGHFTLKR